MFRLCRRVVSFKKNELIHRKFATKESSQKVVKYTDTINLPKTKFPQRLSGLKRAEVEKRLNKTFFAGLYRWQRENLSVDNEFVLHDGPPYANGELHMGHAINKILKDIILRQNIINGRRVHYRPGWDCHGLPIELKAMSSTSTDENVLKRLNVRKKARSFALTTLNKQKTAFASWGITADWDHNEGIYRTLDTDYISNQLQLFQQLYERGLVYRDLKPVFWSPSSGTALAEAELEYDANYESPSLTLRMKVTQLSDAVAAISQELQVWALIWTTTPWSLPANQAICFNADLEYSLVRLRGHSPNSVYIVATSLVDSFPVEVTETIGQLQGSSLCGCKYLHPINANESLQFLPAGHVQATKGTGLVHTAPAHGPDDYLVSLAHKIPLVCLINEKGAYNATAPEFLQNQSALTEGNALVLSNIQEDIVHLDHIRHSYPIDWRTKKPILIRASNQWFINTERLKEQAIQEISTVEVYPRKTADTSKGNLINQLRKRPYWCISRQRAWGTPIPVFYSRATGVPIVEKSIIDHLCNQLTRPDVKNADLWWTSSVEELIPLEILDKLGMSANEIEKGNDILDIWFDSGVSWSYALDGKQVADIYLEGIDQFTGWFQSSLMTSVAVRGIAPYKSLFVHGFAVDEHGHKMSKSLGNIIVPQEIIEKYGTDTLRWWVAHHAAHHTSVPVGQSTLQGSSECVQKLRATLKYLVGCLSNMEPGEINLDKLKIVDVYFLRLLATFERDISAGYAEHQYNRVAATIVNFITNDVSAFYLHTIKDRLYCGSVDEHQSLQSVLHKAFLVLNKAVWPITPFLVEECWSYFDSRPFYELANVNVEISQYENNVHNDLMKVCEELKQLLYQCSQGKNTWNINLAIDLAPDSMECLQQVHPTLMQPDHHSELCELLQVSSITLRPSTNGETTLNTTQIEGGLCARCRRFAISSNEIVCSRCDNVLKEKK